MNDTGTIPQHRRPDNPIPTTPAQNPPTTPSHQPKTMLSTPDTPESNQANNAPHL